MSKAIRCDRCKECFDPYTEKEEFAHIEELYFQDADHFKSNEVTYRDEGYDLCPGCSKTFSLFMRGTALIPMQDYIGLEKDYEDLQVRYDMLKYHSQKSQSS